MKCGWVWWTFYILYRKVWLRSVLENSDLKTENEAGVGFKLKVKTVGTEIVQCLTS
jgi:hypothetical protein